MQLGPFGIVPSCVEEIESWKKRQSLNTQHHQCGQSVVKKLVKKPVYFMRFSIDF